MLLNAAADEVLSQLLRQGLDCWCPRTWPGAWQRMWVRRGGGGGVHQRRLLELDVHARVGGRLVVGNDAEGATEVAESRHVELHQVHLRRCKRDLRGSVGGGAPSATGGQAVGARWYHRGAAPEMPAELRRPAGILGGRGQRTAVHASVSMICSSSEIFTNSRRPSLVRLAPCERQQRGAHLDFDGARTRWHTFKLSP